MSRGDQPGQTNFSIRPAERRDLVELAALLNVIIQAGGTTAIEQPMSEADFAHWFLSGPDCVSCQVAVEADGTIAGFQVLERHADLPADWLDIATFTRRPRKPGFGSRLFPVTREIARRAGFSTINATIRADNIGGLAYYAKLGFIDYKLVGGVPLRDGTPVDRLSKRYDLS